MKTKIFKIGTDTECEPPDLSLDNIHAIFNKIVKGMGTVTSMKPDTMKRKLDATEKNLKIEEEELKKLTAEREGLENEKEKLKKNKDINSKKTELANKLKSLARKIRAKRESLKKRNNERKRYMKPIVDTENPIKLIHEDKNDGRLYSISNTKAPSVIKKQRDEILFLMMEAVDSYLQGFGYKICGDNDEPLKCENSPVLDEDGEQILDKNDNPVKCNNSPILDELVILSLFDMEAIGKNIGAKENKPDRFVDLGLRTDESNKEPDSYKFIFRLFNDQTLWIPTIMVGDKDKQEFVNCPLPLIDTKEEDYYYATADGKTFTQNRLARSQIAWYQVKEKKLISQTAVAQPEQSGAGGGAMRADKVDEADYKWTGPKALGCALNLDLDYYLGEKLQGNAPDGFTETHTPADSEIRYFKKFKDPCPRKKNKPKITIPLHPPQFKKDTAMSAKKKKGEYYPGAGKSIWMGEKLKHKNTERQSAGMVMKEEFDQMGLKADGVKFESATEFAGWVLATDEKAKTYFKETSDKLALYVNSGISDGKKPPDDLKISIRTDQEWCHLFGHGDGGSETYDNFISGSKHCNTEQLAIETGQRYKKYKDGSLTVRITAYLIPNDGIKGKTNFTADERAYLRKNFVLLPLPETKDAVQKNEDEELQDVDQLPKKDDTPEKIDQVIKKIEDVIAGRLDFREILPEKSTPFVPGKADYDKLAANKQEPKQKRLKNNVCEKLKSIIHPKYPLGAYVRYKIYNNGQKIFDHTFCAQKESFDYNEFKILETTVKRLIAVVKDAGEQYADSINNKVKLSGLVEKAGVYKLPEA